MIFQMDPIDPVAFEVFGLSIRWYGLSYLGGVLLGSWTVNWKNKKYQHFQHAALEAILPYSVLGIILGGRLGYVLLYDVSYYLDNPYELLAIWHGGMAFHGALIGLSISGVLFSRGYKISVWRFGDYLAMASGSGIALGRLANFVNLELVGRASNVSWAVVREDGLARHPSQIYEGLLEGVLVQLILLYLDARFKILRYPGKTLSIFLMIYGAGRFLAEFFREPDEQIGLMAFGLSQGQIFCSVMMLLGLAIYCAKPSRASHEVRATPS